MNPGLLLSIALLLLLPACGKDSGMVSVRLVTGLEKSPSQTNLLQALSSGPALGPPPSTGSFPCLQADIRAGYQNILTGVLAGFVIPARTQSEIASTGSPPSFKNAMDQLSFPEIRIEIPRNTPVEIGMIGAVTTGGANDAGFCMRASPLLNSIVTYSLFGRAEYPNGLSNESVIPLQVWGLPSSIPPAPPSTTSSIQDHPSMLFKKMTGSGFFRIRYFEGQSAEFEMVLNFPSTTVSDHYIPRAGLIHVQRYDNNLQTPDWVDCTTPANETPGSILIPIDNSNPDAVCGSANIQFSNP
jgi:hypothetical protein